MHCENSSGSKFTHLANGNTKMKFVGKIEVYKYFQISNCYI